MPYAIYILKCSDGTYYTGSTKDLDGRILEHQTGAHPDAYTFKRRPVQLVWSEIVETYSEAFQWEHRIKGWSRAKKEVLIRGDIDGIHEIVKSERKKREKIKRKSSRTERRDERGGTQTKCGLYPSITQPETCASSAGGQAPPSAQRDGHNTYDN